MAQSLPEEAWFWLNYEAWRGEFKWCDDRWTQCVTDHVSLFDGTGSIGS
jgi:hypothetical protein